MNQIELNPLLVRKYNQPVPRYTSYPTVPYWENHIDKDRWRNIFLQQFHEVNHIQGISLYLHLPFCESLCTYCGCNKKITTNHKVENEYLSVIEKEWDLYRKMMKQTPVISGLHIGGGTPTFFSPKNLERLINYILKGSIIHPRHEFSIEGHPNNTTEQHLKVLYKLGFRRISYGVQDNDPEVQKVINRIQPIENVERATVLARQIGFTSVNYDLIYGLPLQTMQSMERTINQVIELKPDRIAFYSYAHVPWTSKGQRLFDETHLPDADLKINLYLKGQEMLTANGYTNIGMDHFALPHDELYTAWKNGTMHRNFMGYTYRQSTLLLGLGVSSISDAGTGFAQNEKALLDYYAAINNGDLAITKGYFLNEEDQSFRQYILDIICNGETNFKPEDLPLIKKYSFPVLEIMKQDGLVDYDENGISLTPQGQFFQRNVCSAFDMFLHKKNVSGSMPQFSKAI